jgi:kinesin family member 18/19
MTMQELFERIGERQDEKVTEISLSYLEIYNETIRDLLVPGGGKQGLTLREDARQAVSVAGLSQHRPENVEQVMDMIVRGNECRTMSPTEANATSSRSHAVLQINVSQKDRNAGTNEPHTMATLSIIDLAGSERASATKNRGERLLEGANINKSLLALGSCINALCDVRRKNHVPYRNSKLTRLLKFSLGGNCKTVMIVCVSPSSAHYDETQNTLRYANRAKNIQTKVTRNVYNVNRHVKDFLKKIDEQMALINELKAQQKDYESAAFAKFRKQHDKKDGVAREGIARLRSAYEHAAPERQERTASMKKLRQIEKRISMISSWIAAFDNVCETREEEDPPTNLLAMRKTALGIQAELESSRQHYHQRLAKNTWERHIENALQTGLRQLQDLDAATDSGDISNLKKEAEILKSNADREMYTAVMDQEKAGDTAVVQVLLQAHFETVAILNQIMTMDEQDAVSAAKRMLGKIISACSESTSQVIKPEGGLPVTEAFPPTKCGTPKRRKPVNLMGPSPMKPPVLSRPDLLEASSLSSSPAKAASPRRRKLGSAKKGVQFTPKKKSPVKPGKRVVRWKDDTEDGKLEEYQNTPQKTWESTPESSSVEMPRPTLSSIAEAPANSSSSENSSPIPPPPQTSLDVGKGRSSRFQTGFLSKKSDGGSPNASVLSGVNSSSDSERETSPLREIEGNSVASSLPRRSPLRSVSNMSSSSEISRENSSDEGDGKIKSWPIDADAARKVRTAIKRSSLGGNAASRAHRRRSPTASSGSPPGEGAMFSASQARRMGRGADSEWRHSVLSPRTAPIVKGATRRTTMGGPESAREPIRPAGARLSVVPQRGSLAGGSKSAWR